MDLLYDKELSGLKGKYTVTMVAVAASTYLVAVGLIMFVDRQKVIPSLTAHLSAIMPAFMCRNKATGPADVSVGETGLDRQKIGEAGPWSGVLQIPDPEPRQRRNWWKWWQGPNPGGDVGAKS